MAMIQGKSFKQLNRATGAWVTKTPEPQEMNTTRMFGSGSGGRHKNQDLVLINSLDLSKAK